MGKKGMRQSVSHGTGVMRDKIWKAMRLERTFTAAEIEALAEATRDNVRSYIGPLATAGYLVCVREARCVAGDSYPKTWRLVKNTGPIAPRITLDGLYDGNLQPINVSGRSCGKRLAQHAPGLVQQLRLLLEALVDQPLKAGVQQVALTAATTLRAFDEAGR